MQLSVVILNYNVRHFLQLCLYSVREAIQNLEAEIIVVDNHSPDDSCQMVEALFPEVKLIANKENAGFPKGNNIGVAAATGDYICILNPDTVVAGDTFTKILAFATEQANLGIVGCKLIDGSGKFLPESKRGIPTPFTAFTKIAGLYKLFPQLFGKYYAMNVGDDETAKVEILVGAFMLMKRDTYLGIGGFDENCFMYSDDIDLSYMVLKTGKDNYYYAGTTAIHYKGESTVRDELYVQRFRDAMNFFYKKHFEVSAVFDSLMQVGAFLFAKRKKKQGNALTSNPRHIILISESRLLREKLSKLLEKSIDMTSDTSEKKLISLASAETQFVFDSAFLDFKAIITAMQALRGKGSFRIVFEDFMIGSDSSDGRGEVELF